MILVKGLYVVFLELRHRAAEFSVRIYVPYFWAATLPTAKNVIAYFQLL
jgi:hypothetical protein